MTRMLVRVVDAREAAQAAEGGVEGVEFHLDPADQREVATAQAIRAAFAGALRLRFESVSPEVLEAASASHADEVVLPLRAAVAAGSAGQALAQRGIRLVTRFTVPTDDLATLHGIAGESSMIMFESAAASRLIDAADVAHLDGLATSCRANGWPFGFAGGLEAPDVARVLLLQPDMLGFDAAVRTGHDPEGALDPAAVKAIRALLPGAGPARSASPTVRDRLFVRNFVLPLSIGAYLAERTTTQRVRFSVDVEVAREPVPPQDMRDVFSYDIIIETIRRLSARVHVTFVETLAEEIAAALLAQPAVLSTTIRVEKLDIIDGEVGIEIHRRRDS